MHPLNEQLENPLTRRRDARDRARILEAFPVLRSCSDPHFLALRRYVDGTPERFFDRQAYETLLDWLKGRDEVDSAALEDHLSEAAAEIDRALGFLRQTNSEPWHDELLETDDYDLARFVDNRIHPAYLRLVEAVLTPLSRPVAYFSRLDRGKSADGLDVWNVKEEISGSAAECFFGHYRSIIRNGLAHGGVTFLPSDIRYRDKNGNEETFGTRCVVGLCDDLLDVCNGMAAALKVFFSISRDRGYVSPRELLVEELQQETCTPWWTIEGSMPSEIAGTAQLIIYARANTRHYDKVLWSTIQSGILAECFAPGYDRYFFSIRSRRALPGWAAFDGNKLRTLREGEAQDILQYSGILENGLVFFIPKWPIPALLGRLDTIATSFRINWPMAIQESLEAWSIPHITCRNATVHRNSWGAVLNAQVVIEDLDEQTAVNTIRRWRRRIIRAAIHHARCRSRLLGAAYLPIGYACVSVFKRDYRRRRLSGFGLGKDLVCTLRLQRIRRIQSPDILGSTIEIIGNWRIAWNKAWLESRRDRSGG